MIIEWRIAKQRGNWRPVLTYTATLDEYERSLGMPQVRIVSTIPKPQEGSWGYCWPGQNEREGRAPDEHYLLMTPSHKTGSSTETLRLPWREDNGYPEVEASFEALRQAFEAYLQRASASAPLDTGGRVELSSDARKAIAPALLAERLLKATRN